MSVNRTTMLVLGALTLILAHPSLARAEVRVRNLKVSGVPAGPPVDRFEPDTRTVHATFDYEDAVNHRIAVVVTARGGVQVFEAARRYTGSGSDTVAIDGTTVTRALATSLSESAAAAQSDAEKAANQPFGVQEYLQSVKQDLMLAGAAQFLLERAPIGDVNAGRLTSVERSAAEATRLVNEALGLPPAREQQKRDLAVAMAAPLAEMAGNAGQLDRSVARMTDLPIPETGLGTHATYTVQVRVTDLDFLADSVEFRVSRLPSVVLPWLGHSARLGR